ncbi:TPT-domain-containing protein [Violaceomyces palustris]|uniref:TPT-domain-containing protein n=1 Tax=Violaceomyces palustris TaxID=1673888 RepID=A0ACD0P4J1_9BASI|nr:TPT-domain-containing protein [Violaceomyces palustris]
MSKEHTSLPMQTFSVDEKSNGHHDPINGHSNPTIGHQGLGAIGGATQPSNNGILPGGGAQREKKKIHPAVIIALWIALSSSVIVYNKYLLSNLEYPFPVFLTTFHMAFATVGTRALARFTHLLDGLADVEMTNERWYRNILPIGALFSGSLVFSNMAYLTLSVSFIQMLKAFTPVAVLLISFAFGLKQLSGMLTLIVGTISFGVATASYGEIGFDMRGFVYQVLAIAFESSRLVMIQVLLQGLKMDPLVSLYYFAPVCAAINACLIPFTEGLEPFLELARIGPVILLSNAGVAFGLNIAAVFLIGAASSLTLTLAGVLKDILLILGSMFLLGSTVTGLQFFGYAIALGGLVAFKTHKG